MEALKSSLQQLQEELLVSKRQVQQETERAELMQHEMMAHMDVLAAKGDAEAAVRIGVVQGTSPSLQPICVHPNSVQTTPSRLIVCGYV